MTKKNVPTKKVIKNKPPTAGRNSKQRGKRFNSSSSTSSSSSDDSDFDDSLESDDYEDALEVQEEEIAPAGKKKTLGNLIFLSIKIAIE